MATRYVVTGATDLSLDASFDGGTALNTGDELFIRDGTQTIVTGSTAQLNRVVVTAGFKGRIGTASTPVVFRVDNATTPRLELEGGQYFNLSVSTAISELTVNTPAPVYLSGATAFTRVIVQRGSVEIGASTPVTNLHIVGGRVMQQYNATGNTLATIAGGTFVSRRGATTMYTDAGLVFMLDAAAITTLHINGSVVFYHQSTGTIGTIHEGGGLYTPAGAKQDTTVTTFNRYGGRVISRAGTVNADIGTFNDYARLGSETVPGGGASGGDNMAPFWE